MKKAISLCLLLLLNLALKAQDTNKKTQLGIDLAYANPGYFKNAFFPSLTLSMNKHVVFAGPGLVYYDAWHLRPMNAFQGGYRLFPEGRNKRLNLFFEGSFNFTKGQIKDHMNLYSGDFIWSSRLGERVIQHTSFDQYFGFGCRWNAFHHFYLGLNLAAGIGFYKQDYTYIYNDGTTWSAKGGMAMRPVDLSCTLLKLSVGYDLYSFGARK